VTPAAAARRVTDYAGTWNLDTEATTIEFHTKAMWVLNVKGTLRALRGTGTVGPDGTVHGTVLIDAASVDTNIDKRDAHLRTADFLHTARHPTIDFEVTSGRLLGPGRAELTGLLTIRGHTRPIEVVGDVTRDDTSLTLKAEIDDLDRREWHLSKAAIGPSAHSRIVIRARFTSR
jgi:polyisoprenoid-binding protein YceI